MSHSMAYRLLFLTLIYQVPAILSSESSDNLNNRRVCQLITSDNNVDQVIASDDFRSNWCSYINIDSASIDISGNIVFTSEHLLPKLQKYKESNVSLRLMLSLEVPDTVYALFSTKASKMQKLSKHIISYNHKHKLNGFNFKLSSINQLNRYSLSFIEQLKDLFDDEPLASRPIITIDLPRDLPSYDDSADFSILNSAVSFINIRSYDFAYDRSIIHHTQYNSPLHAGTFVNTRSIDEAVQFALDRNIQPAKIVITIPAHAIMYKLLFSWMHFAGAIVTQGPNDVRRGQLCKLIETSNQDRYFDSHSAQTYTYQGQSWITYEDEDSIVWKLIYVSSKQLGGVLISSMNSDDVEAACTVGPFTIHRLVSQVMDDMAAHNRTQTIEN